MARTQPPVLSTALLNGAHIPAADQERFCLKVARLVEKANLGFVIWEDRASKFAEPLNIIAELSRQLHLNLGRADENGDENSTGVHALLFVELRKRRPDPSSGDPIAALRANVSELFYASKAAEDWAMKNVKLGGRPLGIRGYPNLAGFIIKLARYIITAGGIVTIDKRNGTGNFIEVLDALRGALPVGFMPPKERHPVSTYDRYCRRVQREMSPAKRGGQND